MAHSNATCPHRIRVLDVSGNATMENVMARMDPKLLAKTQQYEVSYFARKHRMSAADAREILQKAGRSREKATSWPRRAGNEFGQPPA